VTYKLYKLSAPGWTKTFDDKFGAQAELYKHICNQCLNEEGITEISDIQHMLASCCGCEFDVEEVDGRFDYLDD
jgi:hypothetical protein